MDLNFLFIYYACWKYTKYLSVFSVLVVQHSVLYKNNKTESFISSTLYSAHAIFNDESSFIITNHKSQVLKKITKMRFLFPPRTIVIDFRIMIDFGDLLCGYAVGMLRISLNFKFVFICYSTKL